jgi:hypothetical protein
MASAGGQGDPSVERAFNCLAEVFPARKAKPIRRDEAPGARLDRDHRHQRARGVNHRTDCVLPLRHVGDVGFPDADHFAAANRTAAIPVASGRTDRHRLNGGGIRRLNCALY